MKGLKLLAIALCAALACLALWLVLEPRSSPDDFLGRKGNVQHVELGPLREEAGEFVSQEVSITSDTGLRVALKVLRPAGDETVRRPLAVLLAGHRTGRDAVRLLGSPGTLAVAALDYPYDGPERVRGWRQGLSVVRPARRALRDTPAAVLLATDWLLQQPWVDTSRADVVGVSLGVPFACIVGAIEPRYRKVWLIHGGADLEAWISHNLTQRIDSPVARAVTARVIFRAADGSRYEPAVWVPQIAPRRVTIIGAREDRRLPRELVEKLFGATREPKQLHWMDGDHVDRRPEAVRELLEFILDQLEGPDE